MFYLLFLFILLIISASLEWFIKDWHVGVVTAIYQMKTPLDGTNPDLFREYASKCIPIPVVITAGLGLVMVGLGRCEKSLLLACQYVPESFSKELWALQTVTLILKLVCLLIVVLKIVYQLHKLRVGQYLLRCFKQTDLFDNIKAPVVKAPTQKRNLLLIYLESMEITYTSREEGGGKPVNLIPHLTRIAKDNISFSNSELLGGAHSMPGTDWTMGGLFASQSALPLKLDLGCGRVNLEKSFMPGVTSLGDILKEAGYKNIFQCGSDATFGGRRAFFEQHGQYEIKDLDYAKEKAYIPQNYHEFRGYEDEKLFSIAKAELTALAETSDVDHPFNYTMLTLDTHHPHGYKCSLCQDEHEDEFSNIISCSDRQLSGFLDWVMAQPWYENTTVVLLGDHPSMVAGFWDDIGDYENKPYNCFVNLSPNLLERCDFDITDGSFLKNRQFTHFDLTPTILEALGFEIENKMGLGVSLFSREKTLAEKIGVEELRCELYKKSEYYNKKLLN